MKVRRTQAIHCVKELEYARCWKEKRGKVTMILQYSVADFPLVYKMYNPG